MPMIKLDELNADKAYQLMEKASNKWSECEEKEIILEEGKKAILGNLINQEQANSVDKLTDKKADNKARNNPHYQNMVKQYANAVKETLKAKMLCKNLDRYSSMKQTELNIEQKLAGKQGG